MTSTNDIERPPLPEREIDRSLRLPDDQYIKEETAKDLIVLHHTVGGSAGSTHRWWLMDPRRVGTAYIVGRDGTIFEVFDPKYWCYHIAVGDSKIDKRSIGIELASEGALTRVGEFLYAFDGKKNLYNVVDDKALFYDHGELWRGYQYFDRYDDPQIEALWLLCVNLMATYGIPHKTPADHLTADKRKYFDFKGIIGHHHVRQDKTDMHPAFPWDHIIRQLRLEEI